MAWRLAGLQSVAGIRATRQLDLEGDDWPLAGQLFRWHRRHQLPVAAAIGDLLALLAPGGVLIYETFMLGNEAYGKPSNPDFLLRPGELRELVQGRRAARNRFRGRLRGSARSRPCVRRSARVRDLNDIGGQPGNAGEKDRRS
jgi:hypothetical protein